MPFITLSADNSGKDQGGELLSDPRILYVEDGSDEIMEQACSAHPARPSVLSVNGVFNMTIMNQKTLYALDQPQGDHSQNFDSLFDLVSRVPECRVTFTWPDREASLTKGQKQEN